MATRNYDFAGNDRNGHSFHPSERISEAVPIAVPGGEDQNGVTDAVDIALDDAAREQARGFLIAWPDQPAILFCRTGERSNCETVYR